MSRALIEATVARVYSLLEDGARHPDGTLRQASRTVLEDVLPAREGVVDWVVHQEIEQGGATKSGDPPCSTATHPT